MKTTTLIALAVLSLQTAWADNKTLSLQQCMDLAVANNYQMQAADKATARAKALQGTAWDVEKTSLSLSQDPTSGGSPDNALTLSQTIDFPTLYAARRSQLKAETAAEQSKKRVVENQLRGEVAAAYWQLVYQTERIRILQQQDTVLARYAELASKRYAAGETRKLEQLSAERMQRENALELAAAKSEKTIAQKQLSLLLNTGDQVTPADTRLAAVTDGGSGYNYLQTAEGQYAASLITAADKSVTVEKNGYAPSFSLGLRTQMVITGWDPYHENRAKYSGGNFMGFEVGVGIPLFWGATRAKVKAAKIERERVEMEMKQQQQQRENEYSAFQDRYNAAYNRMMYYETEGGKQAEELGRLSVLEYENGEISYIEYVNALQESIDMKQKRAAAINDYNQAVIALKRMRGDL